MHNRIILTKEDITKLAVDAIVNAANQTLLGGGGVDGAIHHAAGPELLEECKTLNGCPTGNAKITKGYLLPAKFVIHTVGPVWRGGNNKEAALLENCYKKSLLLAQTNNCKTIAFPNISTGIYGYPKREAAEIAVRTVQEFLKSNKLPEKVYFVCFDETNFAIYANILNV
ncbi:MAG: O-acetyl-ADP-ribose deacetylase [Bacteroidetes bacterium]|nr:MAG: O-acetyl-ADP-ribose deacetylase [Bacteroidota bacterium]RLD86650.1 MAG: O-acetyl-ADP-ribose deacetylase [Bacteroidota bacterium]